MANIDLKKFKKVSADNKCATLKHSDGHELKIAYSALSPKLKKELDALPMAFGGDTKDNSSMQGRYVREVKYHYADDKTTPFRGLAKDEANKRIDKERKRPKKYPQHFVDGGDVAPSFGQTDGFPDQSMAPSAGAGIMEQNPFNPQQIAQQASSDMLNETNDTRSDMDEGHITPKTYSDLYENKSTLGKIGTMFGMLMSGAGSGLAHQPNLLMQMMDKEIDRDLDAQKTSKSNKLNWYNAHLQKDMNQATINKLVQDGRLTSQQAEGARLENIYKSHQMSLMGMRTGAAHSLGQRIQNTPIGTPIRANGEQALNTLNSGVNAANAKTAAEAGPVVAAIRQKYNNPSPQEINDMAGDNKLLSPGSSEKFQALQGKMASEFVDQGGLKNQYDSAVQAEKALPEVDRLMNSLYETAKQGGTLGRFERGVHDVGSIPYVGKGLESVWAGLGDSPTTREFLANKEPLYGMVSSALKGTNLGDASIRDVVDKNLPDPSDSAKEVASKVKNIKDFIKQHTSTSLLETYGLAPKHGS